MEENNPFSDFDPVAPVSTRPQVFPAQSGIPSASGFQPAAKWPPHLSHSTPSTINHFESTTSHPAVHPAQFALSANHINQQQQDQLNLVEPPKLEASATSFANDQRQESSKSVDCGAGNDLGFCTFSATYPRLSSYILLPTHRLPIPCNHINSYYLKRMINFRRRESITGCKSTYCSL